MVIPLKLVLGNCEKSNKRISVIKILFIISEVFRLTISTCICLAEQTEPIIL